MDKTKISGTKLRIFEAFAGIGAQRQALNNIKSQYEIAGLAEWFVPAIVSYQAIHNEFTLNKIKHDVSSKQMIDYLETKTLSVDSKNPVAKGYWKRKKLNEIKIVYSAVKASEQEGNIFDVKNLYKRQLKNIDLLTYSFPCQDLSQQGKQKGMSKTSNTRSGLLWEVGKALDATPKKDLPQYLLMENVVALTHKTHVHELEQWLNKLKRFGYKNDKQILNASDFGAPQARRRVFVISSLKKTEVKLPKKTSNSKTINCILDKNPKSQDFMPTLDEFTLTNFKHTKSNINKAKLINYSAFNSETFVYDPQYIGPTLTAQGANSRIKIKYNGKIRKLNAREVFKYMGFTETNFNNVNNLNYLNETKMIFVCGNSISVEVLEEVMKNIEKDFKTKKWK